MTIPSKSVCIAAFALVHCILLVTGAATTQVRGPPPGYVHTPIGYRLAHCVHEVPSGSTIEQLAGGVAVFHPNGTKTFKPELRECMEDVQRLRIERGMRRHVNLAQAIRATQQATQASLRGGNLTAGAASPPQPEFGPSVWLDNAAWYLPLNTQLRHYSAEYHLPTSPKHEISKAWLYYFIGLQDMDAGDLVTILQPVLAYNNKQWSMRSWHCCPSGYTHMGENIEGITASDIIDGTISSNPTSWTVVSTVSGRTSSLTFVSSRKYNWVDATLETYDVDHCGQFPAGQMWFNDISLTNDMNKKLTPTWVNEKPHSKCGGDLNIYSPSAISITHSPSAGDDDFFDDDGADDDDDDDDDSLRKQMRARGGAPAYSTSNATQHVEDLQSLYRHINPRPNGKCIPIITCPDDDGKGGDDDDDDDDDSHHHGK